MSVTNMILGRWELAVADNAYIKNKSASNIGVKTFKVCRLTTLNNIYFHFLTMTLKLGTYKPFGPVHMRTLLARIHIH